MPSFNVNIFIGLPPAISITMSGNTTYEEFKTSLGYFVYRIDKMYLFSPNLPQIQGSFFYNKYDANGNQKAESIISAISPYQYRNSIYLDLKQKDLILDGRDFIKFTMQPNTTLSLKLYVQRISVIDEYEETGVDLFKQVENNEGIDFFEKYNDYL